MCGPRDKISTPGGGESPVPVLYTLLPRGVRRGKPLDEPVTGMLWESEGILNNPKESELASV